MDRRNWRRKAQDRNQWRAILKEAKVHTDCRARRRRIVFFRTKLSRPPVFICAINMNFGCHRHLCRHITNSREQCPSWGTNMCPCSQEIARVLWRQGVYYCVHKEIPLILVLSQLNPANFLAFCFFRISAIIAYLLLDILWSLLFQIIWLNIL